MKRRAPISSEVVQRIQDEQRGLMQSLAEVSRLCERGDDEQLSQYVDTLRDALEAHARQVATVLDAATEPVSGKPQKRGSRMP